MGRQNLALDLVGGNAPRPGGALRLSHAQKNNHLAAFFDGVIDEGIGRIDFQPFRAPPESGRLRGRIAQSDHQAPEGLPDLRVDDMRLDIQPLFRAGEVDCGAHPVHISLHNRIFHHRIRGDDVDLLFPLGGGKLLQHLKHQLAQHRGVLSPAEADHPRPLVVQIDRAHLFLNPFKLFKHDGSSTFR